jgi:hypothetical protein
VSAELEQLAAEVAQMRHELSRLSESCRALRRDAEDALSRQEDGDRHLRLVRGG